MTCGPAADLQLTGSCGCWRGSTAAWWAAYLTYGPTLLLLLDIRSLWLSALHSTLDCDSLCKLFASIDVATLANNQKKTPIPTMLPHATFPWIRVPDICLSSWKRVLASGFCSLVKFVIDAKRRWSILGWLPLLLSFYYMPTHCSNSICLWLWDITFRQEVQFEAGSASEDAQSSAVKGRVSHLWHMLVSVLIATDWNPGWSRKSNRTLQREAGKTIFLFSPSNWTQRIQQETPAESLD